MRGLLAYDIASHPYPLPWPGWVLGTQGPLSFQRKSPFPDSEANKLPGKGLWVAEPISSRNLGPRVVFILVSLPPLPATEAPQRQLPLQPPPRFWSFTAVSPSAGNRA